MILKELIFLTQAAHHINMKLRDMIITSIFDWDGDIPDSFIVATDELPYDNDAPPVYGSLQLKESDGGMELNTRCYTNLQE